jgi:hypothetical protein
MHESIEGWFHIYIYFFNFIRYMILLNSTTYIKSKILVETKVVLKVKTFYKNIT